MSPAARPVAVKRRRQKPEISKFNWNPKNIVNILGEPHPQSQKSANLSVEVWVGDIKKVFNLF